jgi:4-amino-4-deoxychorismate lyase
MNADEAFLSNSLIGIWPLGALDQRRWKAPGPVTIRLAATLAHPRLVAR